MMEYGVVAGGVAGGGYGGSGGGFGGSGLGSQLEALSGNPMAWLVAAALAILVFKLVR
jgi:hypothetical protein